MRAQWIKAKVFLVDQHRRLVGIITLVDLLKQFKYGLIFFEFLHKLNPISKVSKFKEITWLRTNYHLNRLGKR